MKIKLKFDRDELKGLITILQNLQQIKVSYIAYDLYREELSKMWRKYLSKMIESPNKKKFSITPSDYQIVLLWELLNECADNFQPFERSIALTVIAQIDRQYQNHLSMLMNFMGENKNNLLLSPSKILNLQ